MNAHDYRTAELHKRAAAQKLSRELERAIATLVAGLLRNFVHGRHHGACNSRRNIPALLWEQVWESWTSGRV
jgi:hypothetical protein